MIRGERRWREPRICPGHAATPVIETPVDAEGGQPGAWRDTGAVVDIDGRVHAADRVPSRGTTVDVTLATDSRDDPRSRRSARGAATARYRQIPPV
jgi:hypothetical protein